MKTKLIGAALLVIVLAAAAWIWGCPQTVVRGDGIVEQAPSEGLLLPGVRERIVHELFTPPRRRSPTRASPRSTSIRDASGTGRLHGSLRRFEQEHDALSELVQLRPTVVETCGATTQCLLR
jgi:hypothetical protein